MSLGKKKVKRSKNLKIKYINFVYAPHILVIRSRILYFFRSIFNLENVKFKCCEYILFYVYEY